MRYNSYDLNNIISTAPDIWYNDNAVLQEYLDNIEVDKLKEGKERTAFYICYNHVAGRKFRLWKENESGKIFIATSDNHNIQAKEMHVYNIITREYERVDTNSLGKVMYQ